MKCLVLMPSESLGSDLQILQQFSYSPLHLKKKKLFTFAYAGCSLLHGLFSNCSKWGVLSRCGVQSSNFDGFSYCRAQALGRVDFSRCGLVALQHEGSS